MSLIDVKRAIDMWERVNVPILGLVENMSFMINPANGEKIQMFPKGELRSYLDSKKLRLLGEIPFNPSVGLACEAGVPIVESHPQGAEALSFFELASKIIEL
jgi:ATP-binding protein involved in chromosome partitioning